MWDHRNKKAKESGDDGLLAELHESIAHHFRRGQEGMPAVTTHHFTGQLEELLSQNMLHKRTWLANVMAARERHSRRQGVGNRLAGERSLLHRWIRLGRPPDDKERQEDNWQSLWR